MQSCAKIVLKEWLHGCSAQKRPEKVEMPQEKSAFSV